MKGWRKDVVEQRAMLAEVKVAAPPTTAAAQRVLGRKVHGPDFDNLDDDDGRRWTIDMLGAALAVLLADAGYQVTSEPGGGSTRSCCPRLSGTSASAARRGRRRDRG